MLFINDVPVRIFEQLTGKRHADVAFFYQGDYTDGSVVKGVESEMRRKEREVIDYAEIEEIIRECRVCRLGFSAGMYPYIVPMNFGYENVNGRRILFFHCAGEGRKLDLLRRNPDVAFEMDCRHRLMSPENKVDACGYSYYYASVMGTGRASFLFEPSEKEAALLAIMRHMTAKKNFLITKNSLRSVTVFQVEINSLSCKKHGSF